MKLLNKNIRHLLFVTIIIDIVGSALEQKQSDCESDNHFGYLCERYRCGKTRDCSLGGRPAVAGDSTFECKVGRLTYWNTFKDDVLPNNIKECPNGDCEASQLTKISLERTGGHFRISIKFSIPPTSTAKQFYPNGLLLNISSNIDDLRHRDMFLSNDDWVVRFYDFHTYIGTTYDRVSKRHLYFPCMLLDIHDIYYKVYNLEFTVFSWTSVYKERAHNLTRTLMYNVTTYPARRPDAGYKHYHQQFVSTIAVAKYPTDEDLHVVFSNVTKDVVKYRITLVDMHTGEKMAPSKEVFQGNKDYSCYFYGIKYGYVQVVIEAIRADGTSNKTLSHPVDFGVKSIKIRSGNESELASSSTVVLSLLSAAVVGVCLIFLLWYIKRKKIKSHDIIPTVLLLYSNRRSVNREVIKEFAEFLTNACDCSVTYEGDEKERVIISRNIYRWYQEKINWCTHVIVIWFPGALKEQNQNTPQDDPNPDQFKGTLNAVLNCPDEEKKKVICVYFDSFADKKSIPKYLLQTSDLKVLGLPEDYDKFYYKLKGKKCPNNLNFDTRKKLETRSPGLHEALENARKLYIDGIVEPSVTESFSKTIKKRTSIESDISEVDPNCPIHGKIKLRDCFHNNSNKTNVINKSLPYVERHRDFDDIHPPSDENLSVTPTSSYLEEQIDQFNSNSGHRMPYSATEIEHYMSHLLENTTDAQYRNNVHTNTQCKLPLLHDCDIFVERDNAHCNLHYSNSTDKTDISVNVHDCDRSENIEMSLCQTSYVTSNIENDQRRRGFSENRISGFNGESYDLTNMNDLNYPLSREPMIDSYKDTQTSGYVSHLPASEETVPLMNTYKDLDEDDELKQMMLNINKF